MDSIDERFLDPEHRNKPKWFKFYYEDWIAATYLWSPYEKGWYFNLLMNAASLGMPVGFLPDDDEELKYIAEFKELPDSISQVQGYGVVVPIEVLEKLKVKRERSWRKVLSKFSKSKEYPGMIYNSKLRSVLDLAYKNRKLQSEAGLSSWEAKLEKDKSAEINDLRTGVQTPVLDTCLDMCSEDLQKSQTGVQTGVDISYLYSLSSSTDNNEDLKKKERKSSRNKSREHQKLFDEEKFIITPKLRARLTKHLPELDDGDLEFIQRRFCNNFVGQTKTRWDQTFVNFAENQLAKYNYKPGDYKWRERLQNSNNKPNAGGNGRYESKSERDARVIAENEEFRRGLREGNGKSLDANSDGLQLDSDDFN